MVTPDEIKEIAGESAAAVVSELKPKDMKPDEGQKLEGEDEIECECEKLKPMAEWLAEPDKEGEQCHECIMRPIGEYYMGALSDAKADPQVKQLEKAWETQELLTIGRAMDKIKSEVGESLKKRLTVFDCLAQTYKPEVAVDKQQ
jgi:hypothetical protein